MTEKILFETAFARDPNSGKKNESWVKALPLGEVISYEGREIEFSESYLKDLARETRKLYAYFDQKANGEAYRFPVLRNHQHSHDREGDLLEFKMADKQGFDGLWVKARWKSETLSAIEEDKIKHISVGITPKYKTEDGKEFGPVIREVSLTSDPYLKGIGTIQDTLNVELSTYLQEGGTMPEDLMEMLTDMKEMMADMKAMMSEEEEEQEEEEEETEASQDEEEVEASQEPEEGVLEEVKAEMSNVMEMFGEFADSVNSEIKELKLAQKKSKSGLATQPAGGESTKPEVLDLSNLTEDERIELIMEQNDVGRLKALEIDLGIA